MSSSFAPFSGATYSNVDGSDFRTDSQVTGAIPGLTPVYTDAVTTSSAVGWHAKTFSCSANNIAGSSSDGFKIGFCCAFYTHNPTYDWMGVRDRACDHYALISDIKYTVTTPERSATYSLRAGNIEIGEPEYVSELVSETTPE